VLGLPAENTSIKALAISGDNKQINSVELLGSNEKISWSQQKDGLMIKPARNYPSENAVVYRIKFK